MVRDLLRFCCHMRSWLRGAVLFIGGDAWVIAIHCREGGLGGCCLYLGVGFVVGLGMVASGGSVRQAVAEEVLVLMRRGPG